MEINSNPLDTLERVVIWGGIVVWGYEFITNIYINKNIYINIFYKMSVISKTSESVLSEADQKLSQGHI